MNKASEGDRIPVQLFQILEDDAVKVLHSKLSSGHRTGKGQFSFHSQRKTIKWERLEISSINLEIPRDYFMQRWAQ